MKRLSFVHSHGYTVELTKAQMRRINQLYANAAAEAAAAANRLDPNRNISSAIRQGYLRNLEQQLKSAMSSIGRETEAGIRDATKRIAEEVVKDNLDWLRDTPLGAFRGAYSMVPDQVVRSIVSGQLYDSGFTLSSRIWQDVSKKQSDIEMVVAKGLAMNKSAFDIAKDLEQYVNPNKQKPWDWGKVYPGSTKVIDYYAQMLARTMSAHAYQQAFVRITQPNPFVTEYVWHSVFAERTCKVCEDMDGQHYSKNELPLDHPNGMCYYEAFIPYTMDEVADRLADWALGGPDPELDEYSQVLSSGYGSDPGRPTIAGR